MSRPHNPQLSARTAAAIRQVYQCRTPEQLAHVEKKCRPLIEDLENHDPPHEVRVLLKGITNALKWRSEQIS